MAVAAFETGRFDFRHNPKHSQQNPARIIHVEIGPVRRVPERSRRLTTWRSKEVLNEVLNQLEATDGAATANRGGVVAPDRQWLSRDCLKYEHGNAQGFKPYSSCPDPVESDEGTTDLGHLGRRAAQMGRPVTNRFRGSSRSWINRAVGTTGWSACVCDGVQLLLGCQTVAVRDRERIDQNVHPEELSTCTAVPADKPRSSTLNNAIWELCGNGSRSITGRPLFGVVQWTRCPDFVK